MMQLHKKDKGRTSNVSKIMIATALTLVLSTSSLPVPVHAQTVKVKPIFTDSMSWAPRDLSADTANTFNFNISDRFSGCSDLSLVSSDTSIATGSLTGYTATIKVNNLGTPVFTISGTDNQGNLIIDTFRGEITKLGDLTGHGIVTTADALFISRYLSGKVSVSDDEKLMMDINGDGEVTNADVVALTNLYVGGKDSGSDVVNYTAIFRDINDLPIARDVSLLGSAEIGQQLTGTYSYFDVEKTPEGTKQLQWYIGSHADGSDKEAIQGATSAAYTIKDSDVNNYLFFGVTPSELNGQTGKQVLSAASAKVEDKTALVASLLAPSNGQTDVDTNLSVISVTFSKNVTAADKSIKIRRLSDNTTVTAFSANDTSKVTINGKQVDIHVEGLQESTDYYMEIEAGAFKDAFNNQFGGTSSSTWKFATWDKTPPTVVTLLPNKDAVSVDAALPSLSITFDENISAVSDKNVFIRQTTDNVTVAEYAANDAAHIQVNGKVVTVLIPPLTEKTGYYVEIERGAFVDASSNPFEGIAGNEGWAFTTAAAPTIVTVTAETDPVSLTENNLDAALITLSVTGNTFKDTADESDFQLNSAPPGLSIAIAYIDSGKAYLLLEHDWHPFSTDITNFSVTAKASAFTKGAAATSNNMTIAAVPQTLNPFFAEYLDGGDGRMAFEIYYTGDGDPAHKAECYDVEVQQYYKLTHSLQKRTVHIPSFSAKFPYIIIDSTFYDAFDLTNITYFNIDTSLYSPNTFETTAIILKKNGQIIDVLGTPEATSATPILPGGGDLVRKAGTIGGMTTFELNHWTKLTKKPDIYKNLGKYTS